MAFKTNVMRIAAQKKIEHRCFELGITEAVNGEEAARLMGLDPKLVYKTLVTIGASKQHYVFVIPVEKELDLKKAAKVSNEKNIEMIKSKELLALTGYVHGGCSPIGMKKLFPTFLDSSAKELSSIVFSAGKIGYQIEMSPKDLQSLTNLKFAEITA